MTPAKPNLPRRLSAMDGDQEWDDRSSNESERSLSSNTPTIVPKNHFTKDRIFALLAVCTMSIGSHFGMYLLGPLKSRLHREMNTSNAQFSLLIAAYNLNSTWTPLVAGLFVARFGTGWSSIATTGCILIGQLILFLGMTTGQLFIMTAGLFVFGLGVTPLAVTQETLVARLSPSKHLGISLALGLVSGKMASFVSSLVSLPMAEKYGDPAPFGLSVILCLLSFSGNAARLAFKWGNDEEDGLQPKRRRFSWGGVNRLGDVFWVYILLNVFSGMIWAPFLHLSANIVKERYSLTDGFAAVQAAILLSGALILYPVTGLITDRLSPSTPTTSFRLIVLSSILTLSCYSYLSLPPTLFGTPLPGMILFALGHGMSTLLMVILIPRFLPSELIPLGLGLHKSMETASAAMSQTLSGIWLDASKDGAGEGSGARGAQGLLGMFWFINILQLGCAVCLWNLERRRRGNVPIDNAVSASDQYEPLPLNDLPSLDSDSEAEAEATWASVRRRRSRDEAKEKIGPSSALAEDNAERRRSKLFLGISVAWIVLVWIVFLVDVYIDL